MADVKNREPWLRGTLMEVPAVHRAVLHSFEMAREDIDRWCAGLTVEEWNAHRGDIASIGFHVRHIAGSVDRLLTYAEGSALSDSQTAELKHEMSAGTVIDEELRRMRSALEKAAVRVRALAGEDLEAQRIVGRERLPTSLGGLLVHIAEHTQRHVGQAITTAKLIRSERRR
jgi:hypothetical protein